MKVKIETVESTTYEVECDKISIHEGFLVASKDERVIHMIQKEYAFKIFIEHEDLPQIQSEAPSSGLAEIPLEVRS